MTPKTNTVIATTSLTVTVLLGSICLSGCSPAHREARVAPETKATSSYVPSVTSDLATAKNFISSSKSLIAYGKGELAPKANAWARHILLHIKRRDRDYKEARRLLATIPRNRRAEAELAADLNASARQVKRELRELASGAWSQERIKAALADPKVQERQARDLRGINDAIKSIR